MRSVDAGEISIYQPQIQSDEREFDPEERSGSKFKGQKE